MRCKARSQAYAFDWPRWKRETVHVATPVSSTIGTTTIPHAFSHCAKVRSSAMINRWISSLVFRIFSTTRTMPDCHCADQSYACAGASPWPASPLLRRGSPDRHGRGVDYSIALVERLSAFFIMLIGFEWVRPRLTPGT